tara:strand:- start:134 stop:1219 length:1086 start_codon:yes stop_codon:yes gene_type:complete
MIHNIFSVQDATIYETTLNSTMNTGLDEILEIDKTVCTGKANYVSRAMLKFDLTELSASIVSTEISSGSRYYLSLSAMEGTEIPLDYNLYVYPVSQSWSMGSGRRFNTPITTDGASWEYRDNVNKWITGSYSGNSTGSYGLTSGGAVWYTGSGYEASQSFNYSSPDTRIDVTDIVNKWLTGTIPNDGLIVKRLDSDEASTTEFGNLKFFSQESHTIYLPKLQVAWDNSSFITGSLLPLNVDNKVVYTKGLKKHIKTNSKVKIRVAGRPKYPQQTFATSSAYRDTQYLPTTTYYSVEDTVTEDVIIPFDDNYTKVSCDATGNYFDLWTTGFLPERYYKLVFKVTENGYEEYFDDGFYFKVVR